MNSPRSGYAKGAKRIKEILDAAESTLIDSGYHNFSMRKVSKQAGISVGNLQYYYATKEQLLAELINRILAKYLFDIEQMRQDGSPIVQFKNVISLLIRDLNSAYTTKLFPELWSLANHNESVNVMIDDMYEKYRAKLSMLIMDINNKLTPLQVKKLSTFILSSIEGQFIFIGYGKKMIDETDNIVKMATKSFLWLINEGETPKG